MAPVLAGAQAPDVVVEDQGTGDAEVTLLATEAPPLRPGQEAWIHLTWTVLNTEAREFRVTGVQSDGHVVGVPENTVDHSSLYWDDVLSPAEIDYTAIKILVPADAEDPMTIDITLSYVSDSGAHTEVVTVDLPVDTSPMSGPAVQATGSLGSIPAGEISWVNLGLVALVDVSDISVVVADSAGMPVAYPAEADHSALSLGGSLVAADSDTASIRFDATQMEPGDYEISFEVTSSVGTASMVETVTRVLTIVSADADPVPGPDGDDNQGAEGADDQGPEGADDQGTVGSAEGDSGEGESSEGDSGEGEPEPPIDYQLAESTSGWEFDPYGTDTATTGHWEIGVPEEIVWNGFTTQLGDTPSGQPGVITTGARGASTGVNDVDSGATSALSPVLDLPDDHTVTMSLSWYFAHLDNSSSEDSFRLWVLTEAGRHLLLEERGTESIELEAAWTDSTFDLSDFAGESVRILIEAADNAGPSLIEAAIADLRVSSTP